MRLFRLIPTTNAVPLMPDAPPVFITGVTVGVPTHRAGAGLRVVKWRS